MRSIVVLGSTGSIGRQTLDVAARLKDRLRVIGLAAHNNVDVLARQANEHAVSTVCIGDAPGARERLTGMLAVRGARVLAGVEGMCELAAMEGADLVVMAVAGAIGIRPTHAALDAGKDVALASKEVLVAAGEHTMRLAARRGARILPIDSEHSAVFQCLQGAPDNSIEEVLLTASGGPFRMWSAERMAEATPADALKHPTWAMGGLVTVNSATLMNKGLEVIEAHWLFGVSIEAVSVVVHPQSVIHSLVRFRDGSVLAQLGPPDMRLPIQYALLYPERVGTGLPTLDLAACAALTFEEPDAGRFPALRLARAAAEAGGTMPAVMNAANEAAVGAFLAGRIRFPDIMGAVARAMDAHDTLAPTYDNVLASDRWARAEAGRLCGVQPDA
ncbi:MAG: 1-deoxy-D-xylulose-5-phosphate reductoisomerase [Chthonomonadales bacterium]|nr:1-deoxy-D-xylulose-5-phosphate reductoisomerase [Chthonomonadales bacterium]